MKFSLSALLFLTLVIVIILALLFFTSNQEEENIPVTEDPSYLYRKSDQFPTQVQLYNSEKCSTLPLTTYLFKAEGDYLFRANLLYSEVCDQFPIIPHQLNAEKELIFITDDSSLVKVNLNDPQNPIIIPTILDDTDMEIAIGLDGKLYCVRPYNDLVYADYGPTTLHEIDINSGEVTFLADLDLTTGRYPGALCAGPDGLLYLALVKLQIVGGIGYSDWPGMFVSVNPETYEVIEIGEIGGNFAWPGKDMIILNGWVYVTGYRIPDYFGVVGRFRIDDPSQYEQLSNPAFLSFFGGTRMYSMAIVDGKLWIGRDDTFFEINPDDGSLVGPVYDMNFDPVAIKGGTSLESIASIGAYKVVIKEFDKDKFPSLYQTEQALNIINEDFSVNFKYIFMPAGTSITFFQDQNTGIYEVKSDYPYVVIQK